MKTNISHLKTQIQKSSNLRPKPSVQQLGFGKYFTDHMFVLKYTQAEGWNSPQIIPYQNLSLDPAATVLHYGQALFEGMKAFRQQNGSCVLFRPQFNWQRMTEGAERLCMQSPPKELWLQGLKELISIEKEWIPKEFGSSLYIRPTLIATEGFLGVRPAQEYLFYIICSPVGSYYSSGAQTPVKIWVEEEYVRAVPGGLGTTKAGANYACSLKASVEAKKQGYAQVLWLDGHHENIEEVGTMNVFFVIGNEVITPSLDGSILEGGTRQCVIQILKENGLNLIERKISIKELLQAYDKGLLKEAFGTGTAAVVTPIGELASKNFKINLGQDKPGPIAQLAYDKITSIQYGLAPDTYGWIESI